MKPIPQGSKGEGLRELKKESPETVKKMGFFKNGGLVSPRKEAAGAITMPTRNATSTNT